jgi:hypothetical protein
MKSFETLLSDAQKARDLRGGIWRIRRMGISASGIVIQNLSNGFGTIMSGIVSVNHTIFPWVILIRSKNFA